MSDVEHDKLKRSWAQQVFYSSHKSGRKTGVAILVHRQINFTPLATYRDPHGRYIMVNGSIDGVLVSLINIYAPNEDEPNFMHTISNLVLQKCSGVLLLGGDFNCVLSPYMDKQPSSKSHASQMSKALKHLTTELGLIDVWRNRFPRVRDYTFYSHRHASYSRIDFFFTSKTEEHRIDNIEILPITLSDHAPLSLSWNLGLTPKLKLWRLNASLLNDSQFCEFLHTELNTYLELNTTPEISPLTLWDCAKAYIRGRISFVSARKKRKEARRCELEAKIKHLEQQHKKAQTANLLSDLKGLRSELNSLINEKIEGNLRFVKQKYYEQGSRASRLLAIRLRKQQTCNMVQKLKSDQTLITKPNQIASCFANFFESLYKNSDTCEDDNTLSDFLEKIHLKTLPESVAKEIDEPIREQEILQVISNLKTKKSPGPDGFINEFYKKLKDKVTPLLLKAYHCALQTGTMAPSWNDATIVVIHKESKDPTNCQSYRPISLLNTDLRILTTILAKRVSKIITQVINPDQTGFIAGRHYGDNVRRLLNLMSLYKTKQEETMILSLDAQKAFDRVSWQSLGHTLERFKFGPNLIKWIQTLYSNPMAAVRVNGTISGRFPLERGCRQGCPLSPLLFEY